MTTNSEFNVSGMTCGHCEMSVREEVQEIPGVTEVQVSHQAGRLVVSSTHDVDPDAIVIAVEEAGYQAVPA